MRPMRVTSRVRLLRVGTISSLLAAILFAGGAQASVLAAPVTVGTSSAPRAFQHSAADKIAYLHDGSLLVGYYDGANHSVVKHVTNPSTSPVSATVDTITGGSEVTFYTLPSTNSTEIWVSTGSELTGGMTQEQVHYGTYNGSTFSWHALTTVPGSLTSGRQDPTVTWTGKWLIDTWWDDTLGGNTDTVFYNWTTVRDGTSGWHVPAKSGTTAVAGTVTSKAGTTGAATLALATTITYATAGAAPVMNDVFEFGQGTVNSEVRTVTLVTGTVSPFTLTLDSALDNAHAMGENDVTAASAAGATTITYSAPVGAAPVAGDMFQFGTAISNNGTVNCTNAPSALTFARCDADFGQITGVSGSTLTVSPALAHGHAVGEPIRIAAQLLTSTASNSVQVSMRHSVKLGATLAVYGAACQVLTRTLLDGATDPNPGNWTSESAVDSGSNDCEGNFGGPQISIDEATGNVHVFEAVTTSNSSTWSGVTYWLGTPDGAPMISGNVSWNSRLIVDGTGTNATDPPDVGGTVDPATGRVYVFWGTHGNLTGTVGGSIKYATIDGPSYTSASAAITVSTGSNNHYPHVPEQLLGFGGLAAGYVPLAYESGSSIVLDNSIKIDNAPPTVPTGLHATTTSTPTVVLAWNASTDDIAVTGYSIYRNGNSTPIGTASGTTYTDTTVSQLTTYTYAIDAFDAAGKHSAQTATIMVTTGDTTPPTTPTGLSASANPSAPQAFLNWTASTDNVAVTGYTIYRGGVSIGTVGGSTLTYTDSTVGGSSTYSYTVDAFDAAGNHSAQSTAALVSTPSYACSTGSSGTPLKGDFTGTGKTSLALITASGQCVMVSNGSTLAPSMSWSGSPFYGTRTTLAGDVTGGGKADLVAVDDNLTWVTASNGSSFGPAAVWSSVPFYGTRGTFLADVNGDGKADLVAINDNSIWVMLSTGTNFAAPALWSGALFYGTLLTTVADMNGDGKADIIAVNNTSTWVMTSTGTTFSSPAPWSSVPFYGNVTTMVGDVSGDGKADLIAVNLTSTWVMTSTGAGFNFPTQWSGTAFYGNAQTLNGDVTGDGKSDLIALNHSGSGINVWVAISLGTTFAGPAFWG